MIRRYLQVWIRMTANSIATVLASRFGAVIFIFGKLFRFGLYLAFIYFLFSEAKEIVGYNRNQTLLFLLSFVFLSATGQMFFREVYRFRGKLVSGEFDFDLIKPLHPLFKNLAGGFDLLDLFTMPIIIYALVRVIATIDFSFAGLIVYSALLINGFLIILAVHILVAAFGVITTEVDQVVMVYRDIETMGRFPVDIYKEPLRQILTFVVPVGLMFTIPAKALLGLLSWQTVVVAFGVGILSLYLSLKFWDFAVRRYSSASS